MLVFKVNVFKEDILEALQLAADHSHILVLCTPQLTPLHLVAHRPYALVSHPFGYEPNCFVNVYFKNVYFKTSAPNLASFVPLGALSWTLGLAPLNKIMINYKLLRFDPRPPYSQSNLASCYSEII